jgi:LPXTG-site transpeptidase (sortase) family protein
MKYLHRCAIADSSGVATLEMTIECRRRRGRDVLEIDITSAGPDAVPLPVLSVDIEQAEVLGTVDGVSVSSRTADTTKVSWAPGGVARDGCRRVSLELGRTGRCSPIVREIRWGSRPVTFETRGRRSAVIAASTAAVFVVVAAVSAMVVESRLSAPGFALAGERVDKGVESIPPVVSTSVSTTTVPERSADGLAGLVARIDPTARASLVLPRLDVVASLQSGVADRHLARGVGHYEWTGSVERAGKNVNIGLAGHRTTPPAPFRHLDDLRIGDAIYLVVGQTVHRYEVEDAGNRTPHREVRPNNTSVLRYRGHSGLTLTTCTPVGSDARRLIVFARWISSGDLNSITVGNG